MRNMFFWFLSLMTPLMAENLLPLENGNTWTYREAKSGQSFTVRVSTPFVIGGKVYHTLKGYAGSDLLVRVNEEGQLVFLELDGSTESVLTPFVPFSAGWWNAPYRTCDDTEAQAQERRVEVSGAAGRFSSAREVVFRSASCRDAGVEREQFAANIGMVRRIEQSIAGPRQYDLVYARIGKQVIEAQPGGRFAVTVAHQPGAAMADVTLRLETGGPVVKLPFASSQEFEIVLRDASGAVRWRYSDLLAFTPAVREREVAVEWSVTVRMPVPDPQGRASVPYTVTAWLTTTEEGPKYAATAAVELRDR